ncbi:MAG: hypothetical protein WAR79_01635 [Melioribacteraceae bacterium]
MKSKLFLIVILFAATFFGFIQINSNNSYELLIKTSENGNEISFNLAEIRDEAELNFKSYKTPFSIKYDKSINGGWLIQKTNGKAFIKVDLVEENGNLFVSGIGDKMILTKSKDKSQIFIIK